MLFTHETDFWKNFPEILVINPFWIFVPHVPIWFTVLAYKILFSSWCYFPCGHSKNFTGIESVCLVNVPCLLMYNTYMEMFKHDYIAGFSAECDRKENYPFLLFLRLYCHYDVKYFASRLKIPSWTLFFNVLCHFYGKYC